MTGVPAAGTYALQLRYANGTGGAAAHDLGRRSAPARRSRDAAADQQLGLPGARVSVPVTLAAGDQHRRARLPDRRQLPRQPRHRRRRRDRRARCSRRTPRSAATGAAWTASNGSALTTPGLLYQDGWTLLDDTAVGDLRHRRPEGDAAPGHGGEPYQDGYVFGYGQDYKQGLTDLATLTGPTELLPRWAYGVWYSEYYDRTAADYENTILPTFRSEGVPLDVLVTDTDFKSPDTWNGWEIDPTKFPDPKGVLRLGALAGPAHHAEHPPEHPADRPAVRPAQATRQRQAATTAATRHRAATTSSTGATRTS